jgi:hypothetical protein
MGCHLKSQDLVVKFFSYGSLRYKCSWRTETWSIISGEEEKPSGEGDPEFPNRDTMLTRGISVQCVFLQEYKRDMYYLLNHYETEALANKLFLRCSLFTLKFASIDTMSQHIKKVKAMAYQLQALSVEVEDSGIVMVLLSSLLES